MSKRTRIGIIVAVFFGVSLLIDQWQSSRYTNDSSTRDDSGEIVESGSLGVLVAKVGDCVLLPPSIIEYVRDLEVEDGNTLTQVQGVPCTELHDAEIVGEISFIDRSYPGQEALFGRMDNFCVSAYENYTGVSFQNSPHDYFPLVPNLESWAQGDRKGQCYAVNVENKQLGASLRG